MTAPATPRLLLISDFTIAGLAPYLASGEEPRLEAALAPFDQVMPMLLDANAECWSPRPEAAFVWTRPASIRAFARAINHDDVTVDDLVAEVDAFADAIISAAARVPSLFVATWTTPAYDRGLGILNFDPKAGPAYLLGRMNLRLAERLGDHRTIHLLDAARWQALAGSAGVNPKLWHLGKIAFGPEVLQHAAADLKAAIAATRGRARKLVVLDLDETLWGGVVGDVGWQQLRLGGHDAFGEAFVAFQRALKRLTRRGIVLAIVSKNTEAIALEAIDQHPERILRRDDFVGWRINWQDKAANIAELAAEINLGLDSVVFIDDNPAERARVRGALPDVLVPEWPADKLLYEQALASLSCFDTITVSDEDRARTRMYVSERERTAARQSAQSMDDYLATLGIVVTVEPLGPVSLARATQLLNKTNQMNLTTRRLTETEFSDWSSAPGHRTFVFRVADRFDDYGLTGIASVDVSSGAATMVDYVLSCRVMGRGVEETMIAAVVDYARDAGAKALSVALLPTKKNGPCLQFLEEKSGLRRADDPSPTFRWELTAPYPAPAHVRLDAPADLSPAT